MRLELRLADNRSAYDVERLVNRRSLRLWPGGKGTVRLQSDYCYRRQSPKWVHLAFVLDAGNFDTPTSREALARISDSELETAYARAVAQSEGALGVAQAIEQLRKEPELSLQGLLTLINLALGMAAPGERGVSLQDHCLTALFRRYPQARLAYLEIDSEASQRLSDMVLLHLYERRSREEVNRALFESGFFPQIQGGFSPVRLVANAFAVLSGFLYPWLYFVPIARPGGVFLLLLGDQTPFDLGQESPSVLESLGFSLGQIHGGGYGRMTDLTSFITDAPPTGEVEDLALALASKMNDLLVALYDINGFETLDQQLSACFTTARLVEESATGLLSTNPYLRKITFFNVWDKVTCVQKAANPSERESDIKRDLACSIHLRNLMSDTVPESLPVWTKLRSRVFEVLVEELQASLLSGLAPWLLSKETSGRSDYLPASLLVDYRNTVHGYRQDNIDDFLSHSGFIPDSVIHLAFFWSLSVICRPARFLHGGWVSPHSLTKTAPSAHSRTTTATASV